MNECQPEPPPAAPTQQLAQEGWAHLSAWVSPRSVRALIRTTHEQDSDAAGSRNWLAHPVCAALARRLGTRLTASGLLPVGSVAVQCTLFDKRAERNWLVAFHQDLSLPARAEGGLSRLKDGEHFTQAPDELLAEVLAVRIHLDDCGSQAGPLRVVLGSHRHGRLNDAQAHVWRTREGERVCTARAGDALLMRPLLLHASSRMEAPVRRRVLHFLFAPLSVPAGWRWNRCVPAS